MKPRISILCPTRNRPKFVKKLILTAIDTAKEPEQLEFIFYVDNDDSSYDVLFEKLKKTSNIKVVKGERIVLSEMWNKCWDIAEADIFMHCGDDIRFRTENWDQIVCDKFDEYEDKIIFTYGYDGYVHARDFGTHGFIHRNWTDTLGYMVPPYFSSDYNDTWLNDIAKEIGRHFYIDIYTEHIHPVTGKYHYDQTHKDRLARANKDNPKGIYESKVDERHLCAQKLIDFIQNYNKEI